MMKDVSLSPSQDSSATLFDVRQIAELLGCSSRHVQRLADAGRMPRPIHLGRLLRWQKAEIESWVVAGCPNCRLASNARGK